MKKKIYKVHFFFYGFYRSYTSAVLNMVLWNGMHESRRLQLDAAPLTRDLEDQDYHQCMICSRYLEKSLVILREKFTFG